MFKVEKLSVFLSSINSFFAQIDGSEVSIDTPYLNNNKTAIGFDYSGVIKISGPLEGCVYVSAPSVMLRGVINVMGEPDSSITMMKDLLGEMANTISGNARTEFGSEFIISTPQIVESAPSVSYLPRDRQSYITPFTWRGYKAVIGICIA